MKPQRSQAGVTLLIVLIFLQIFVTLSIYAFENVMMTRRLIAAYWHDTCQDDWDYHLLARIESLCLSRMPHCVLPMISSVALKQQTAAWWAAHACSGNFLGIRYYYAVEFLGVDPCARIKSRLLTDDYLVAAYYRLSIVRWLTATNQHRIQQSTLVKAIHASDRCEHRVHEVYVGRQSWRMLE